MHGNIAACLDPPHATQSFLYLSLSEAHLFPSQNFPCCTNVSQGRKH